MTDQDLIIAVAKLDGWEFWTHPEGSPKLAKARDREQRDYWTSQGCFTIETNFGVLPKNIPDYLTSRDAIIPVIEKQPDSVIATVCMHLIADKQHREGFRLLLSKPKQLAIALVKATGGWKE